MNDIGPTQARCNDLHGFAMIPIGASANGLNTAAPGRKQGRMLAVQGFMAQGQLTLRDSGLQHVKRGLGTQIPL